MKKILITGASGFIGNKMANYLLEKGYEVIGWDLKESYQPFELHIVNLLDEDKVIDGVRECHPDIIIHCAGSADVGKSVKNPQNDFRSNVLATHNLLFALHKFDLHNIRFVFLSSAAVYGNPSKLPICECELLNPLSPYALHKEMCEKSCEFFYKNYGLDIKIARIFSAYGDGLEKQIFWDMFSKYVKSGKLEMFGTGNESRDYIHVDDVIKCLHLISEADSDDHIFNVANGEETSIKKVTELFANILGEDASIISFNNQVREGDPLNWKADISRITKLGYIQSVSLNDGLERYINWLRSREG